AGDADYAAYRARLERDPAERAALADMLLITITEFFRDPEAWDAMRREVVPALAARAREGHEVRVWCAGCGTGEEAYSVALLLLEELGEELHARVRILATDAQAGPLAKAREGVYAPPAVASVDALRRARFFEIDQG